MKLARDIPLKEDLDADLQPKQTSVLDTLLMIRKLTSDAEGVIFGGKGKGKAKAKANDPDSSAPTNRELFHSVIDTVVAKLTHYRDILPRATTLTKLRNGKVCKTRAGSRQIGSARVFTRAELNAGLKKLKIADKMKREPEQAVADRKKALEGRRLQKQALEVQWRFDFDAYTIKEGAWCVEYAAIIAEWKEERDQARIAHKHTPKKPALPAKPK